MLVHQSSKDGMLRYIPFDHPIPSRRVVIAWIDKVWLFGWHDHEWPDFQSFRTACKSTIVETHQFSAMAAG